MADAPWQRTMLYNLPTRPRVAKQQEEPTKTHADQAKKSEKSRGKFAQYFERRKTPESLQEKDKEIAGLVQKTIERMATEIVALTERTSEMVEIMRHWKAAVQKEMDEHAKVLERVGALEARLEEQVRRSERLEAELDAEKKRKSVVLETRNNMPDAAPSAAKRM